MHNSYILNFKYNILIFDKCYSFLKKISTIIEILSYENLNEKNSIIGNISLEISARLKRQRDTVMCIYVYTQRTRAAKKKQDKHTYKVKDQTSGYTYIYVFDQRYGKVLFSTY